MKELLKTKAFKYLLASIVFSMVVVFGVNTNFFNDLILNTWSATSSSGSGGGTKYVGGDIVLKSGVDLIPNSTKAADMKKNTANLQRAIDTVSTSGGGTVTMPSGTFYFSLGGIAYQGEEYAIRCRNNVTLIGAGTNENNPSKSTILKPYYNDSKADGGMDMFYFNNYVDTGLSTNGKVNTSTKRDVTYTNIDGKKVTLEDQTVYLINADFYDFVIDAEQSTGGIAACGGKYRTDGKGFMINLFMDCDWDNVVVKNTDGTGFGVDCPINSTMNNCKAINCGKAATSSDGGASGFGIGSGYSDQESFIITNSVAINNKKFGFFFEHQARFSEHYPSTVSQGFVVANSVAGGNMYDFGGLKTFDLTFQNVKSISGQGVYTDANLKKSGTNGGSCGYSTINYSGNGIKLNTNTNPIYFSMYSFNNNMINADVDDAVKDLGTNKTEVSWAINEGILPVINGTTFGATDAMSRYDAIQAFFKYSNMPGTISTKTTVNERAHYKNLISSIGFGDLGDSKYQDALDAIVWAHDNGIISKDSMFNPTKDCTRSQFVTMLYRLSGSQGGSKELPFTDVPKDAWYYRPLQWAYENGLIKGTTSTTFNPDGAITKQQFAAVLYKYEKEVRKDFRIVYNLMGGEGTNRVWYTQDELPYTLKTPSKDGYNFLGWTGSNGGTPAKTVKIAKGTTGDLVYTANWEEIKASVKRISVSNGPIKTIYTSGEELDTDGLSLLVTYSDGTTRRISMGYSVSPTTVSGTGEQKIVVSYRGKETSFYVTVKPVTQPKVTKIVIDTPAKKQTYNVGDKVDTTGLVLEATYTNGTTKKIDAGFTVSPDKMLNSGKDKTITIRYGDATTSYKVTVNEPVLKGISISTYPSKREYEVGELLNTSGLVLKATYSDGSTKKITSGFSADPVDMTKAGTYTITVTYGDYETSYEITVKDTQKEKTLKTLEIEELPKIRSYTIGDRLSTTGLVLKATYSDKTVKYIYSGFTKSHTVLNTLGEQEITITYKKKEVKYMVTVNPKETITATVTKIEIYNKPSKKIYKVSELLDTTNLAIKVYYSDGVTKILYEGFDVSPIVFDEVGEQIPVYVIFEKKRASFFVTVEPDEPVKITVKKISVSSYPTVLEYMVGDTLRTTGLKIKVTYSDNSTRIITSGYKVSPTKLSKKGTQKIKVTYEDAETSFYVVVNEDESNPKVEKIEITQEPDKKNYKIGDVADTNGLMLTVTYEDGSKKIIFSGFKVLTDKFTKTGKNEVVIEYEGAQATYGVTVIEPTLSSVVVNTYPTNQTYTVGDKLDSKGLSILAIYNDGSTKVINNGFTVSPTTLTVKGVRPITVQYAGKETFFYVTVNEKTTPSDIISRIYVSSKPTKQKYKVGDVVDTTGLRIGIVYTDGAIAEIMDGFTVSKTPFTSAGTKSVAVTYMGKTTSFNVTVEEVVLSSIAINTPATNLTYTVGDKLDSKGLSILATYSDDSTKVITSGFTVSPTTLNEQGVQRVTVTYNGKTTYYEISVNPKPVKVTLSKIKVKTKPKKLDYTVGDKVNTTGLILTATYSNGSSKQIMTGFTVSPTKLEKSGKQKITITYEGKTTTYEVDVSKKKEETSSKISKIAIKTQPNKIQYKVGDELDTTGLVLKATYKDGSTKNIKSGYTVSPTMLEKTGKQTITVKYEGKKATFTVDVDKVKVESIAIKTLPNQTSYFVGDKFSYLGLVMSLSYDNGYINEVSSDFNLSIAEGTVLNEVGTHEVIIYHDDLQLSFNIEVLPKNNGNLIVASKPDVVTYFVGDEFSTKGLVLNLVDKNGKMTEITSNYTASIKEGTVLNEEGTLPVIITYNNEMTEFDIEVLKIKSMKIKDESVKRKYSIGETFSSKGMVLVVEYTNGTKEEIKDNYDVEQLGKFEKLGEYNVKVTYGNEEANLRVRVVDGKSSEEGDNEENSELKTFIIVLGVIAGSVVLIVIGFNIYLMFL